MSERALPCETYKLRGGGVLLLRKSFLNPQEASRIFAVLRRDLTWGQGTLRMFGKTMSEPRLRTWVGDKGAQYKYSGKTLNPAPWHSQLLALSQRLSSELGATFNSVLANLYRDERDSMGWHADDEPELGPTPTIASLSLGETRRFWLKHPKAETLRIELEHGDLLVMGQSTQRHWKHCVPKETKPKGERINLTFRDVLPR